MTVSDDITYEVLPSRHFLIYFTKNELGGSTKDNNFISVVAKHKSNIIAVCGVKDLKGGRYASYGTFVSKEFRGKGIASTLWKKLLGYIPADSLEMNIVSKDGEFLAEKLTKANLPVKLIITFQENPNYKPSWLHAYEEKTYANC